MTVSDANDDQAFKITVSDDPHFATIKADKRSRIQDTAITAEALLPGGPYNLWRDGETSRRVKDLVRRLRATSAPAQDAQGAGDPRHARRWLRAWVVRAEADAGRTTRFRTWWRSRPDENALADPALELVLPEAAELGELSPALLAPDALAGPLGGRPGERRCRRRSTSMGPRSSQVPRKGYDEPMQVPKAPGRRGPTERRGGRAVRSCLDDIRAHERTGRSRSRPEP